MATPRQSHPRELHCSQSGSHQPAHVSSATSQTYHLYFSDSVKYISIFSIQHYFSDSFKHIFCTGRNITSQGRFNQLNVSSATSQTYHLYFFHFVKYISIFSFLWFHYRMQLFCFSAHTIRKQLWDDSILMTRQACLSHFKIKRETVTLSVYCWHAFKFSGGALICHVYCILFNRIFIQIQNGSLLRDACF